MIHDPDSPDLGLVIIGAAAVVLLLWALFLASSRPAAPVDTIPGNVYVVESPATVP